MPSIGTTAAVIANVFWTVNSTVAKKVVRGLGTHIYFFMIMSVGLLPSLVATFLLGVYNISLYSVVISLISGVFGAFGFVFVYISLRTEQLTNTSALNEIQYAVLVLFGLLVLGEKATLVQILGMLVIFSGALMIITTRKLEINRKLIPAVLSAVSWAVYWIMLTYAIDAAHTFALPLFISRIVGLCLATAYLFSSRVSREAFGRIGGQLSRSRTATFLVSLAVIGALADGIGDTVFGVTIGNNVLAIGSAISAFSPMIVSFFGFLFYKEKLTRMQFFGLMIMVVGAIVLSVF